MYGKEALHCTADNFTCLTQVVEPVGELVVDLPEDQDRHVRQSRAWRMKKTRISIASDALRLRLMIASLNEK